jgi:hypothetical protein
MQLPFRVMAGYDNIIVGAAVPGGEGRKGGVELENRNPRS